MCCNSLFVCLTVRQYYTIYIFYVPSSEYTNPPSPPLANIINPSILMLLHLLSHNFHHPQKSQKEAKLINLPFLTIDRGQVGSIQQNMKNSLQNICSAIPRLYQAMFFILVFEESPVVQWLERQTLMLGVLGSTPHPSSFLHESCWGGGEILKANRKPAQGADIRLAK